MTTVPPSPRPASAPAPVRALVVDDDPSIVRFLEIYLGGHGFRIQSTLRGEEVLQASRSFRPDVIVLDARVADQSGQEVLRRLGAEGETCDIPVLLMVARGDEEGVKASLPRADDYITKPFDIVELRARLLSLVTRRREQAEETEAEKRKTLREVVAGVSHELNNPLAAVLMAAEAMALRHPDLRDVQDKSRLIQDNVMRIRDILKRLDGVRMLASKPYVAGERMLDLGSGEDSD